MSTTNPLVDGDQYLADAADRRASRFAAERDQHAADRRKLAAFPAMLKALDLIATEVGNPGHVKYMTKERMREVARAALAAAEGTA